jgi:hypothetical protein
MYILLHFDLLSNLFGFVGVCKQSLSEELLAASTLYNKQATTTT